MERFNIIRLLIVAILLKILGLSSIAPDTTRVFAQAPQAKPVLDKYGNVLHDGEQRFNYLIGKGRGFTRVKLDEQNQMISRQSLTTSPFDPGKIVPVEAGENSLAPQVEASNLLSAKFEW